MSRQQTFMSDELSVLFMKQIAHEQLNANIYVTMSNYFGSIGLVNCHKWFSAQTKEELEHAEILYNFLTEAGVEICLEPIDKPDLPNESVELMKKYLETEIGTTESIKELAKQALLDNDFISFKFLNNFIYRQLAEESEAQTRLQIFLNTNDIMLADHAVGDLV